MNAVNTLHARLVAAVEHRLELARAAEARGPSPWAEPDDDWGPVTDATGTGVAYDVGDLHVGRHIAANSPATVIRHCEADLERLAEHGPSGHVPDPPCDEIRRIARAYGGVETEGDDRG